MLKIVASQWIIKHQGVFFLPLAGVVTLRPGPGVTPHFRPPTEGAC